MMDKRRNYIKLADFCSNCIDLELDIKEETAQKSVFSCRFLVNGTCQKGFGGDKNGKKRSPKTRKNSPS